MGHAGKGGVRLLVVVGLVVVGAGLFLALGPPGLLAKSETPDFCASCHVMEAQYESWFHHGAHKRIRCVDCHLPNDNLANQGTIDGDVYLDGGAPSQQQQTFALISPMAVSRVDLPEPLGPSRATTSPRRI